MSVETATYLSQLNASYPAAGDSKSEGDDHLRLTKSTLLATFPNFTATPITATSSDLNKVTFAATTGAVGFNVATQTLGDSSTLASSTAFVAAAMTANLGTTAANAATATTQAGISTTKAGEASASAAAALVSQNAAAASAVSVTPLADQTHAATDKATPVDADEIPLSDSAASWGLKKLTWANLKATAKTYNDTLYAALGSGAVGFRNRIINGNFSVNQRSVTGTVVLTAGVYGHDRFKAGASGCTYTFSTTANVTTLTISAGSLVQVVEGLNVQSGTHVLSWVGTATGKIDAGSFSASGVTGTLTGGTNCTVEFSTGTLSNVQLEPGSTATTFEQRPYAVEEALCYRYLPWHSVTGSLGIGAAYNTTRVFVPVPFQQRARVAPTGATVSGSSFNWGSIATSAVFYYASSSTDFGTLEVTVSGATAWQAGNLVTNGTSKVLWTGCEL